jgi:hypothetical protein
LNLRPLGYEHVERGLNRSRNPTRPRPAYAAEHRPSHPHRAVAALGNPGRQRRIPPPDRCPGQHRVEHRLHQSHRRREPSQFPQLRYFCSFCLIPCRPQRTRRRKVRRKTHTAAPGLRQQRTPQVGGHGLLSSGNQHKVDQILVPAGRRHRPATAGVRFQTCGYLVRDRSHPRSAQRQHGTLAPPRQGPPRTARTSQYPCCAAPRPIGPAARRHP